MQKISSELQDLLNLISSDLCKDQFEHLLRDHITSDQALKNELKSLFDVNDFSWKNELDKTKFFEFEDETEAQNYARPQIEDHK